MRPTILFLLAVAAAPAAASPDRSSAGQAGIELVDDVGRTVHLDGVPKRIVSTAPSNTEALFALGVGARVVGVTTFCDYPEEAKSRTKVGDFSTVDFERVLALEPDLVVATWLEQERHVKRMVALGLTVLVLYPESIEETMRSLRILGKAVGEAERADTLVAGLEARLAAIDEKVAAVAASAASAKPRVFVQLGANPLYSVGPGSTVHEAIERAGGVSITADIGKPYATVSREIVIARNPEVVLLGMGPNEEEELAAFAAAPGFSRLHAVENGRVYAIDPGLLFHQNHRLVDGIDWLFGLFHPVEPRPSEPRPSGTAK